MFILEHNLRAGVYAEFRTNDREEAIDFIGTGRVPTVFTAEHLAHEARNIFGLDNTFNVVKLVKEY